MFLRERYIIRVDNLVESILLLQYSSVFLLLQQNFWIVDIGYRWLELNINSLSFE